MKSAGVARRQAWRDVTSAPARAVLILLTMAIPTILLLSAFLLQSNEISDSGSPTPGAPTPGAPTLGAPMLPAVAGAYAVAAGFAVVQIALLSSAAMTSGAARRLRVSAALRACGASDRQLVSIDVASALIFGVAAAFASFIVSAVCVSVLGVELLEVPGQVLGIAVALGLSPLLGGLGAAWLLGQQVRRRSRVLRAAQVRHRGARDLVLAAVSVLLLVSSGPVSSVFGSSGGVTVALAMVLPAGVLLQLLAIKWLPGLLKAAAPRVRYAPLVFRRGLHDAIAMWGRSGALISGSLITTSLAVAALALSGGFAQVVADGYEASVPPGFVYASISGSHDDAASVSAAIGAAAGSPGHIAADIGRRPVRCSVESPDCRLARVATLVMSRAAAEALFTSVPRDVLRDAGDGLAINLDSAGDVLSLGHGPTAADLTRVRVDYLRPTAVVFSDAHRPPADGPEFLVFADAARIPFSELGSIESTLFAEYGVPSLGLERGPNPDLGPTMWAVALGAVLLVCSSGALALGLARLEGVASTRILRAVGAAPRWDGASAAIQAGLVALLAGVGGALVALIASAAASVGTAELAFAPLWSQVAVVVLAPPVVLAAGVYGLVVVRANSPRSTGEIIRWSERQTS